MKLVYNKLIIVSLISVPIVVIFLQLYSNFQDLDSLLIGVVISFCITLLLLLLKIWVTTLLNIFLLKLSKRKISFFSFYPFTYDGKLRFHPVNLLYHQELYASQIPYNLEVLKEGTFFNSFKQYKSNLGLWIGSELIGAFILIVIIECYFNLNIYIGLGLLLLSNFFFQLTNYDDLHFGYLYALHSNDRKMLLLSRIPPKLVSFDEYEYFFDEEKFIEGKVLYAIMLNYLYKCIYEETSPISVELFEMYLRVFETSSLEQINCLKVLGIVGLVTNNFEYLDLSMSELKVLVEYLQSINLHGVMDSSIERIQKYIDFLRYPDFCSAGQNQIIMGVYNIYSYSDIVENQINKLLEKGKSF